MPKGNQVLPYSVFEFLTILPCCPLLIITEGLMQNCSETGFGPLLRCINALPTQYSLNQREFQSDIGGNFFWVNI
ncbi:hypothetical protein MRB53_025250 [Persea americana]|uniref:Uncharacterized protein n=1 Tax=Persea americana TaxID=3435 RepID=A0ACC2LEP2_PERAE|nr:hypothetical protein MRB53_025250 [Persea americana]